MSELIRKTRAVIARHADRPAEDIECVHHLFHDLGFDNLDHVNMVMDLEAEFGIAIGENAADALKMVVDVQKLVGRLLREKEDD